MAEKHDYYKLILTYDIETDAEASYYPYMLGKYVPAMQQKGLEMLEAWSTSWGNGPGRQVVFGCRSREVVDELREDDGWHDLNDGLQEFIVDFEYRVVPFRQGYQL